MVTVGKLIVGAAVTFVVSAGGRTLGGFCYDCIKYLWGSRNIENPNKEKEN